MTVALAVTHMRSYFMYELFSLSLLYIPISFSVPFSVTKYITILLFQTFNSMGYGGFIKMGIIPSTTAKVFFF